MSEVRRIALIMAVVLVVALAFRGVLSVIHDGLSPDWLWP